MAEKAVLRPNYLVHYQPGWFIWARSWDYGIYHISDQQWLRGACASAQSHQSLRWWHTWSMEVNEGSNQTPDIYSTGWLRMCVWRMSLRRTKRTIICLGSSTSLPPWMPGSITLQNTTDMQYMTRFNITYLSRDMTKPTKWVCAQLRLRSAWASAQSDQSLRCPHKETLGP